MTGKLRVRFVLIAMLALIIMQGLIIYFTAHGSYSNMIAKADSLITAIHDAYPEDANVDARYFVATVGSGQNENKLDMTHIHSVKKDQAREYVKAALESSEDTGFLDTFRYRIYRDTQGLRIVFLSRSHSIDAVKSTITSSVVFSAAGLGVMLVFLVILSGWVTRPVKMSYEKQQQFVTSASHELGTPLTVIKANTDILQMDDPENEWLQDIQKQTARLTQMTQRMTTLAKMDEQNTRIKRIVFPISDLAEDVVGSYTALAQTTGMPFSSSIEPDLTYNGEENMIRQLMTILLDNAFKYCPGDGKIDFSVKKASQGILLAVSNTADNVRAEDIPRLFDRFYRSGQAGDSQKKGFGLGLSIADEIIKSHKSKISAKLEGNILHISVTLK